MARSIQRATRRLLPGVLLVVIGLAAAPTAFADLGIDISGFAYDPNPMTIHVGETVGWTNSDTVNHTASADDGSWTSGSLQQGETSNGVRFDAVGTFPYHCAIHASMHGTIVVTAAPPATDALEPVAAAAPGDGVPLAVLALAGLAGLAIARRRFGRAAEASDRA